MLQERCTAANFGLPLCLILVSVSAYGAGPYRFELHGGFSRMNTGFSSYANSPFGPVTLVQSAGNQSSDNLDFAGDYYFGPIETNSGPLQEAAFLAKASALMFSASEARNNGTGKITTTSNTATLPTERTYASAYREKAYGLRYQFVAAQRPWIGVASYDHATINSSTTTYSVGMGRYVGRRTSVVAEYGWSHFQYVPGRNRALTIRARTLLRLGARNLAVSAALHRYSVDVLAGNLPVSTYLNGESVHTYEVGVTYYPRDDVSIALSTNGDYHYSFPYGSEDTRGYRLEADWFFTDSIDLGVSYQKNRDRSILGDPRLGSSGAFNNVDTDGFQFNVSWRH